MPHYDNAEGGNHDTRFCYMGERRLRALEAELPEDVFILGVDGHTALVVDLDARTATVAGLGSVTVRKNGRSTVFPTGSRMTVDELVEAGSHPGGTAPVRASDREAAPASAAVSIDGPPSRTLREEVANLDRIFQASLDECDAPAAVRAILALEETIQAWSRDTDQSDALAQARSALRAAVVCLGEMAVEGSRDVASLVAPFVDELLAQRFRAREARDWAAADAIRDRLLDAGVELHDTADGTTWELRPGATVS